MDEVADTFISLIADRQGVCDGSSILWQCTDVNSNAAIWKNIDDFVALVNSKLRQRHSNVSTHLIIVQGGRGSLWVY